MSDSILFAGASARLAEDIYRAYMTAKGGAAVPWPQVPASLRAQLFDCARRLLTSLTAPGDDALCQYAVDLAKAERARIIGRIDPPSDGAA